MSSCSVGKPDHHKRRCIKTFMHFGSPILGKVKAVTFPILGVATPERRTHYPHFGGTSEFLNRKHFPHFGGDILYVAMYVGKIKLSLPAPKQAYKASKIAVAPPDSFRIQRKRRQASQRNLYETGIFSGVCYKMRPVLRSCGHLSGSCIHFPAFCLHDGVTRRYVIAR